MKQPILVAGLLLSLLAPGMAHAQFAKTEDAIKYRAATFTVMGNHFSRIGAVIYSSYCSKEFPTKISAAKDFILSTPLLTKLIFLNKCLVCLTILLITLLLKIRSLFLKIIS